MYVISIIGTRPQLIKVAAIHHAIIQHNALGERIDHEIIHSGQHYDASLSGNFFSDLTLPEPMANLGIGGGTHGLLTGRMLEHLEQVLLAERPDWVLIYGDCDTTLAAGLAARKIHIPVAHVEAGLRSYDKSIAEEVNRVVADYVSILNFCPSVTCVQNLAAEGMSASIRYTGDIMYDILLRMRGQSDIIKRLGLVRKQFYLATVHRAETTDYPDRLRSVFEALHEISVCRWPVILPMHPRTRLALQRAGPEVSGLLENIRVIDPVTYTEILDLQEASRMVITDSGGLQKEAYWLGVPCVTMTDTNEWIELTRLGVNTVVGTDRVKILEAVEGFEGCGLDRAMNVPKDVYGRGQSADEVVRILVNERLA